MLEQFDEIEHSYQFMELIDDSDISTICRVTTKVLETIYKHLDYPERREFCRMLNGFSQRFNQEY